MPGPFETDLSFFARPVQSSNAGESLASLLESGQRRQMQQQQMQQAAYQQQRQRSLADLTAQSAANYRDPMAQVYAGGGFGAEASQAEADAIQRQERAAKLDMYNRGLTYSRLSGAKTQADYDRIAATLPADYGFNPGAADWQDRVETFGQSLVTPEQKAQNKAAEMRWGRGVLVKNADGLIQMVNPNDPTDVTDIHQSARKIGVRQPGAAGAGGGLNTKEETLWQRADRALNPSTATGELGASQKRVNAANRVLALVDDGKGGVRDLDKREVLELATSLQSLLSPGGHSQAEVEHLVPETYQGNVQGYLEKLSGEPNGLGMKKFVEKMRHTVERERDVSHEAMLAAQYGAVPGVLSGLYGANPERAKAMLRARGLNPDELDERLVRRPKASGGAGGVVRKVLNGKTYEKDADGWHEVTGG